MNQRWWAVVRLVLIVVALVGLTAPNRIARAHAGQPLPLGVQVAQVGVGSDCEDGCDTDNGDDGNVDDSDDEEEDN